MLLLKLLSQGLSLRFRTFFLGGGGGGGGERKEIKNGCVHNLFGC